MGGILLCALKVVMRLKMPGPLKSKVKWKMTMSLEVLPVGGISDAFTGPRLVPLRLGCY